VLLLVLLLQQQAPQATAAPAYVQLTSSTSSNRYAYFRGKVQLRLLQAPPEQNWNSGTRQELVFLSTDTASEAQCFELV
jgi:hypothetical protein